MYFLTPSSWIKKLVLSFTVNIFFIHCLQQLLLEKLQQDAALSSGDELEGEYEI